MPFQFLREEEKGIKEEEKTTVIVYLEGKAEGGGDNVRQKDDENRKAYFQITGKDR